LNQKSANAFVLNGPNLVYVVTLFSEKVCIELHELAQAQTGLSISCPIDDNMIEGVKVVGNSDQMQKMSLLCGTRQTLAPLSGHKGQHSLVDPKRQSKLMGGQTLISRCLFCSFINLKDLAES
jgi:hypothetical protein